MQTIKITVKTVDHTWRKTTDVPLDMLIGDFKDQTQEMAGFSTVPGNMMILDKTSQVLSDGDTFQSAGIQSGDLITLIPVCEGC